jgi:hypothetical protein
VCECIWNLFVPWMYMRERERERERDTHAHAHKHKIIQSLQINVLNYCSFPSLTSPQERDMVHALYWGCGSVLCTSPPSILSKWFSSHQVILEMLCILIFCCWSAGTTQSCPSWQ